ncbi:helix-turn-helix transcriptional regulator [Phytohabitans kaempferiae]|uniref:LuxR C-terminal-related transcriptional regulator n=1 Tax=Phytohabitans kaempferiae TaxID=1620943 RepID=A0ABV6LUR8_9ACTN
MSGSSAAVLPVGAAVPSLVRWGVSADADLVYRCLVSFGPRRAVAVGADLGLAARRVRNALDEMVAAGLVQAIRERAAYGADADRWHAVPVDTAVRKLRQRALRRALAAPDGGRPAPETASFPARRLPGRTATRRRIAELAEAGRVEQLAMHPEQIFSTESVSIGSPIDTDLLRRRVRVRSLGRPPADGDRSAGYTAEFVRLGGEYRETGRLPHKMIIFDRRVALLAVDPLDLARGTWEVVEPVAVASLVSLFVSHWSGATDPRRNGVPTIVLTQREKAVVALLAEGHTEATAAQYLGISTRSVTYTLRGLMDRLGVENRFQLGLALGAMRVVTPPGRGADETAEGSDR